MITSNDKDVKEFMDANPMFFMKHKKTSEEQEYELELLKAAHGYTWPRAFMHIAEVIATVVVLVAIVDCVSGGRVLPW